MTIDAEIGDIKTALQREMETPLRVVLFGQPGSGKSSLINRLVGRTVMEEGASTDTTVTAQEVRWGTLLLVDLPGFGTSKFPPNSHFRQFNVENYDMFLCVFDGKFHEADTLSFRKLSDRGRVCIFVRNKADSIWEEGKSVDSLKQQIAQDVRLQTRSEEDVFFASCRTGEGVGEVSEAVHVHLTKANRQKWARSAKAYSLKALDRKLEASKPHVWRHAALAAVNGANPVPGLDITVDFGILLDLFKTIRQDFGLTEAIVERHVLAHPAAAQFANRILSFATKEGLPLLLKKYAAKKTAQQSSKYIPFVGQVIAASLGFEITRRAGNAYLEDCYEIAKSKLEEELRAKV